MNRRNVAKLLLTAFIVFSISGCAVVNFSGNYYTLPGNYQSEIRSLWKNLMAQVPHKHTYQYSILPEKETKGLKGIPAISNYTVILPENFIKYVYQNYYDDRSKILTCVIVHEICHREFNLPSAPPKEHFKVDVKAIALLGGKNQNTIDNFYKSLYVLKDYWFARKGVGGHLLNVGWNAANAASLALGGPGAFVDWFATDLNERMRLIRKNFPHTSTKSFKRSRQK